MRKFGSTSWKRTWVWSDDQCISSLDLGSLTAKGGIMSNYHKVCWWRKKKRFKGKKKTSWNPASAFVCNCGSLYMLVHGSKCVYNAISSVLMKSSLSKYQDLYRTSKLVQPYVQFWVVTPLPPLSFQLPGSQAFQLVQGLRAESNHGKVPVQVRCRVRLFHIFHIEVIGGHEIYEIKTADGPSILITEKLLKGWGSRSQIFPSATYVGSKHLLVPNEMEG